MLPFLEILEELATGPALETPEGCGPILNILGFTNQLYYAELLLPNWLRPLGQKQSQPG